MSYDLLVEGGRTVDVAQWQRAANELGVAIAFPPGFDLITWGGGCSTTLACVGAGPFDARLPEHATRAEFDYRITGLWLDAPSSLLEHRLGAARAELDELRKRDAPDVITERWEAMIHALEGPRDVESLRARRREELTAQLQDALEFMIPGLRQELAELGSPTWRPATPEILFSGRNLLALYVVGCSLALASSARLIDFQAGLSASMTSVAEVTAFVREVGGLLDAE